MAAVALFIAATNLPFLFNAYHIDEPFFFFLAQQIAQSGHQGSQALFNWYGALAPLSSFNAYPSLFPYLWAPAIALGAQSEWIF